ncbi:MAG: nitrile hydratase subunit beta [Gammaproteobacteria bacterium]|nr:nitrile hydratase subunit beta [Gammaproteobacteria bacterium]MDE0514582.1 nitrile hydratase subunit beta [Gammaproteobacteria bacterium]
MNGIHDIGGMDNIGPVNIEKDEPVFHEDWESRVYAMTLATMGAGIFVTDEVRYVTETIPPADYLTFKYYEKWLYSLERMMLQKNMVTPEELESGEVSAPELTAGIEAASLERMAYGMKNRMPVFVDADIQPRFKAGDAIIARNINPPHHTRIPRYIRGRRGVVEMDHGIFLLPDTNAHGGPDKPQHVYSVRFSARELWGNDAPANDSLYIDLFDDYMDPDK